MGTKPVSAAIVERFEGPYSRRYPARKPDGW
jgi:hypothetical protein